MLRNTFHWNLKFRKLLWKKITVESGIWKMKALSFRDLFHKWFFHQNSNSMENLFECNSIVGYHIASKFCTCHDSIAVMPCATFHSDHFITTWMRAKWNFHRIWIMMAKSFAKWILDLNMLNSEMQSIRNTISIVLATFPNTSQQISPKIEELLYLSIQLVQNLLQSLNLVKILYMLQMLRFCLDL